MRWGVADIEIKYFCNGVERDADFLRWVSIDMGDANDLADSLSAHAVRWRLYVREGDDAGIYEFNNFLDFAIACSAHGIDFVFVENGRDFFHYVDVARLWTYPDRWEVITNERDENGFYKGRNKEAYIERSGGNGERYSFTIWTRSRRIGGNRHLRLRNTKFINIDNIITFGYRDACATFGASDSEKMKNIEKIVIGFDEVCKKCGFEWIGEKRINAETIGTISKYFLLSHIGNKRAKTACALTPEQYQYLSRGKLMRGGITICLPQCDDDINGVYGYDVNSEYLTVARDMSEITALFRSSWEEYENDLSGEWVYIITFSDLCVELKDGMPPVLKGRDGAQVTGGICATIGEPLSFFAEEIEKIQDFYYIRKMTVHSVLKARRQKNKGYKEFAREWYTRKRQAGENNDVGMRFLSKMVINSALGKLAQKKIYDKNFHVKYDPISEFVHCQTIRATEEELNDETGALAYVQGAYVTALARCYIMDIIRAVCGERPADNLLYVDTDSVYSTMPAPPELVGDMCGQLKIQCENGRGRFLGVKCYAYDDKKGHSEIHIAGVKRADYIEQISEESERECTPADIVDNLTRDLRVKCTLNIIVQGGRADVRRWRSIDGTTEDIALHGRIFGRGRNGLFEL